MAKDNDFGAVCQYSGERRPLVDRGPFHYLTERPRDQIVDDAYVDQK